MGLTLQNLILLFFIQEPELYPLNLLKLSFPTPNYTVALEKNLHCDFWRNYVLKFGIKVNPKQNALSGFKLLSRDSGSHIPYEMHVRMFPQATSRDFKQYFETVNYIRVPHGSIPQRG